MSDDDERSDSGAPIYRHEAREREFMPAFGDEENIERISAHIARHIGAPDNVFHELVSDLVHVDIHMVAPSPQRNYYTLVTSGMSDMPMSAPDDYRELAYAELAICLPPDWPLSQAALEDEAHYWPIRWLKMLARLPHEYQTWLFVGHTVPNGDPAEPFASNTGLCCAMLTEPLGLPPEFFRLEASPEHVIHFLSLVPIHADETDFKLRVGYEELLERLQAAGVTELLDVGRPSVCKKKRSFGWF